MTEKEFEKMLESLENVTYSINDLNLKNGDKVNIRITGKFKD